MKGKTDDWFKQEWKDADKILSLDREGMLLQIYKERSYKLMLLMIGIILGFVFRILAYG